MSLILCTDTSTKACTASVVKNGIVISKIQIKEEGYKHAEQLHDLLQSVLDEAGITWKDLDAVAVGKGPGSYTGLRIGVSAVKGICYARKIPLIALPTLQIMAVHAASKISMKEGAILRPMIDARRMEVYTASYSSECLVLEKVHAHVLEEDSFAEELSKNPVYFFGDGMDKCRHLFEQHSNAHFIDDVIPAAWSMAALSQRAFEDKKFEDVAYFEPFYLKEFLAKPPKKLV
jgi:tRNA threonylcarbamoyladenosine biosynthesis protein TsaB